MKILFTLFIMLSALTLTSCSDMSLTQIRSKSLLIEPGMSKAQVTSIMGAPGNRQFQGRNEAWQYKSDGFVESDLHIIWFVNGRVTNTSSSALSMISQTYQPIDWKTSPDLIIESRNR